MFRTLRLLGRLVPASLVLVLVVISSQASSKGPSDAADQDADLGSLSGTVKAPKSFQAARVLAHNIDKNITYMVFTENGKYRAVALLPGNYEVTVEKNGFSNSEVRRVSVTAGGAASADFTLAEGVLRPAQQMRPGVPMNEPLLPYDQLYPPGSARATIERTCMRCHGPDFLPNKHWNAEQWNEAIDMMMSTALNSNPPGRISESSVPGGIGPEERKTLVDYLVKNFGPDSTPRGLALPEAPVDEKALGKAELIEYHLPPLPNGRTRRFHDEHLTASGDVWYVDQAGLQIGKMDPRTATWTDYALPGPQYRGHGLIQTRDGDIWVAGHTAFDRINSETGAMQFYSYDPAAKRPPHGNTPFADSKDNVWTTLMWSNQIAKWDRKTSQVSVFTLPTPYSGPYGAMMDKSDNFWVAEWLACKIAKFDTNTEKFTEYIPLAKPCNIRRLFVDHAGMIWYPMDANSKIGMLNPATGKMVEYPEPMPFSFPYDIQEDSRHDLWIADSGQGGGLYKFQPETKKFTYYPAIQRTDMPKISMSREDSIWYTTRGGDVKTQALGVLYPDKAKIKTLAGYPQQ